MSELTSKKKLCNHTPLYTHDSVGREYEVPCPWCLIDEREHREKFWEQFDHVPKGSAHEPLPAQLLDVHAICDERDRLRRDFFNLAHEFMNDGRLKEAEAINKVLGGAGLPPVVSPLGFHAYAMSERHLSGYRLIVGFDTLEQVQAAHQAVADAGKAAAATLTK